MDFNLYNNMMRYPPVIDKKYLLDVLCLRRTQLISEIEICQVIESNTALTIKFRILITEDGNNDLTRQFFIKTIKYNPKDNAYHTLSLKEVEFYKFIRNETNSNLPIAQCFDTYISEDKLKCLLLLEDISNEYDAANEVALSSENIWLSAACSLAKFHAAFWNTDKIGSCDLPIDSIEKINSYEKNTYESYEKFIKYVGNRFDAETLAIYEHACRISIKLEMERYKRLVSKDNITLIHGDSHIHNFMFPHNQNNTPRILDFQFWGIGMGVGDVAHLTRVSFPNVSGENLHRLIMDKYHETLLAQGIKDYSWENCWDDYRKKVASMLLIPMWQYIGFNLKYDYWINDIKSLVRNYKWLHCEQLEV